MYRVIECLTQEHNYLLVSLAALVCVLGSVLSTRMSFRLVRSTKQRVRVIYVALTSLLGGATIWSTHFIAMLAYEPGFENAYEPVMTAVSLVIAVIGMGLTNLILAIGGRSVFSMLAGVVFGLTVSTMHYIGMQAYILPGHISWDIGNAAASILFGVALGLLSYHRIVRPITRYCWLGGAIFMVLAICAMHFTAMSAANIELNPLVTVPAKVISDTALGVFILAVMTIILFIGFASISIETNLEYESRKLLKFTARHDSLTGLPNRLALNQKKAELSNALTIDSTKKIGVLTIDLNLFKEVNDLYGHAVGDDALIAVSARLAAALEDGEFLARTGGDEFILLKTGFRRVDEVMACAERLSATFESPIKLGEISTRIGAAIGVATSVEDGTSIEKLLHKSDLAMYRAKADPAHDICKYSEELDRQSQQKLLMIQELREAIHNDEFELVYQLQNDVNTLEPIGFEALLRWNNARLGPVPPRVFIPIAEETGLIRDIGIWVLRTACHEAMKWPDHFSIAVNVAPQQLVQTSFLEHVSDILMESRLPPHRLELEITEASIIDDQDRTLKIMHRLKAMGVQIAMDDFGTGYSSLATLQAFPFDKIKIDRSFIQDVHTNPQSAAIVRSTLLLGDALNIPVLAEGVELEDELTFLRTERCSAVQGFYFGKPLNLSQIHEMMSGGLKKTG